MTLSLLSSKPGRSTWKRACWVRIIWAFSSPSMQRYFRYFLSFMSSNHHDGVYIQFPYLIGKCRLRTTCVVAANLFSDTGQRHQLFQSGIHFLIRRRLRNFESMPHRNLNCHVRQRDRNRCTLGLLLSLPWCVDEIVTAWDLNDIGPVKLIVVGVPHSRLSCQYKSILH